MGTVDTNQLVDAVMSRLEPFKNFAENFGKSRFLIYETEVHAPAEKKKAIDEEDSEMEAIAKAFRCEIVSNGNQITLFFYMDERNPGGFLEIVDEGMPPPLAGGDKGTSHAPDGSTYASPTPQKDWDKPVAGYAKPATGVINEIKTMLASLFRNEAKIALSSAKHEIASLVKQQVSNHLKHALAG